MTSTVTYEGELRTTCVHQKSKDKFITDAPEDNFGKGQAFSPTDLTATSLATCMLTVMGIYAERKGIMLKGAKAEVTKVMASDPRRISKVIVDITILHAVISPEEKKILERVALTCPVAKSLHPDIIQEIYFNYVSPSSK